MARPSTGQILERTWQDGTTVTYRARFRAYGRREFATFGTNVEGWNRRRAEVELERILQQVERGTWIPARDEPQPEPQRVDETFRTFSASWWSSKRPRLGASTIADYEWRLSYLHSFFDRHRLSAITVAEVDRFRDELHAEAETIREAGLRDRPLLERVTDKRGRTYQRRRTPLSNTSINAMLKLLGQILQRAVDYDLLEKNPVRVGERSERFLPRPKHQASFLEIDELHALLDAAGDLDADSRADRRALGRRAMLATLALAGFRIGEAMDLKRGQVDLARQRFKIADAKTQAGVREVEMTLYLRGELVRYLAQRESLGQPLGPGDYFFATTTGGRRDPDRFRDRILGRAHAGASKAREDAGLAPLPAITPHSLRRTWATFAATVGRDPKWIAAQIGHRDPALTFSVYQQVATRRYVDEGAIWEVMRFADEPTERITSRQLSRVADSSIGHTIGHTSEKMLPDHFADQ